MATIPTIDAGRFSCPVCKLRFLSIGAKKQHLRTEHPKQAKR